MSSPRQILQCCALTRRSSHAFGLMAPFLIADGWEGKDVEKYSKGKVRRSVALGEYVELLAIMNEDCVFVHESSEGEDGEHFFLL